MSRRSSVGSTAAPASEPGHGQENDRTAIPTMAARLEERKRMEALKKRVQAKENLQAEMKSAVHQRAKTIQRQKEADKLHHSIVIDEQRILARGRQPLRAQHYPSQQHNSVVSPQQHRHSDPFRMLPGKFEQYQQARQQQQQPSSPHNAPQHAAYGVQLGTATQRSASAGGVGGGGRHTFAQHLQQQQQQQQQQPTGRSRSVDIGGEPRPRSADIYQQQNRSVSMQSTGSNGMANPVEFQSRHLSSNNKISYVPVTSRLHTYGTAVKSGRSRSAGSISRTEGGILKAYVEDVEQAKRILKSEATQRKWGDAASHLRSPSQPRDEPPALLQKERLELQSSSVNGSSRIAKSSKSSNYKISNRLKELAMTKGERAHKWMEDQRKQGKIPGPAQQQTAGMAPPPGVLHVPPSRRLTKINHSKKLSAGLLTAHPDGATPLPPRRSPSPTGGLSPLTDSEEEEEIFYGGGGKGGPQQQYNDESFEEVREFENGNPSTRSSSATAMDAPLQGGIEYIGGQVRNFQGFIYKPNQGPYGGRSNSSAATTGGGAQQSNKVKETLPPAVELTRGSAVTDQDNTADSTTVINRQDTAQPETKVRTGSARSLSQTTAGSQVQQQQQQQQEPRGNGDGGENVYDVSPTTGDRGRGGGEHQEQQLSSAQGGGGVSPVPFHNAALEIPEASPVGVGKRVTIQEEPTELKDLSYIPSAGGGGGGYSALSTTSRSLEERTTHGLGYAPHPEPAATPHHGIPVESIAPQPNSNIPQPSPQKEEDEEPTASSTGRRIGASYRRSQVLGRRDLFQGFGEQQQEGSSAHGNGAVGDMGSRMLKKYKRGGGNRSSAGNNLDGSPDEWDSQGGDRQPQQDAASLLLAQMNQHGSSTRRY